jgi:hypothetical protein
MILSVTKEFSQPYYSSCRLRRTHCQEDHCPKLDPSHLHKVPERLPELFSAIAQARKKLKGKEANQRSQCVLMKEEIIF